MKALTIHQPYAELIARGEKLVENRSWRTNYRGELAIHAASFWTWPVEAKLQFSLDEMNKLPRGAIVAVANVIDCVSIEDLRGGLFPADPALLKYATGPWCWILDNVRRLEAPIAAKGKQSLWTPAPDVLDALNR